MPIQDKYSSQIRNAGLANPPVYKLTNNDSPQMHHLYNKKITNHKFASSSHYKLTNPSINRLVNQPTQKLINIQTQTLKLLFLFYNTPQIFTSFQRENRLKSRQITTISSLPRLSLCPFLRTKPAFCTILAFQIGCQLIIIHTQLPAFYP